MSQSNYAPFLAAFSRLGIPLMTAIIEVESWRTESTQETPEHLQIRMAREFNALLTASIVLSTRLSQKLGLSSADLAAGSGLDTAAIAAQAIRDYYLIGADIPDEQALDVLLTAQDPLIGLADQLTGNTDTLQTPVSNIISGMQALFPLQRALHQFAFGLDPRQAGQALATALNIRLETILDGIESLGASADKNEQDTRRSTILSGCAQLLTACVENAQMAANNNFGPADFAQAEPLIWQQFDTNLDMLRQMLGVLYGADAQKTRSAGGGGGGKTIKAPETAAKQEAKKGNPMSFFAKKQGGKGM